MLVLYVYNLPIPVLHNIVFNILSDYKSIVVTNMLLLVFYQMDKCIEM